MTAENPASARLFFFYGGLCRKVLVHQALFSGFVIAATLNGLGNGLMAVVASFLGTAFVQESSTPFFFFGSRASAETLALVGVLATAAKGAGATVGATLQSRLSQKVAGWARRDVATRLLDGGSVLPGGQLAARLSVGLRDVERGVEEGFLGGIRAGLALAPLGAALALVSTRLAWAAVLLLVPFAGLLSFARGAWKRSYLRAARVAEGVHQEVDELVVHMDVWRAYGAAEPVCGALDDLAEQAARTASRAEGSRAALSSANEVLAAMTLLGCLMFARWTAMPLGDGKLIAFAVPFFMAYRPLRDFGDARAALERGALALLSLRATARDSASVLEFKSAPHVERFGQSRPRAACEQERAAPRWGRASLIVDRLGVDRGAGAPVRTSFVARPGEIVALVGPTGAGKTTLLRALLGLEPGAVGSIRYGDDDLTRAGVGPRARPFAWAPQEAPLLAGTLEVNVLFAGERAHAATRAPRAGLSAQRGDPRADAGDRARAVTEILRSIGAERLARECANTVLGASGRPVSGGERKWIALARALASGQPVLLLDEPTAGLDASAETSMLAALDRLRAMRTIVLVTHQPHVMRAADRVVAIGPSDADQNWASIRGSFSKKSRTSGMS